MKRFFSIILTCLILIPAAACGGSPAAVTDFDEAALTADAGAIMDELVSGDCAAVTARFDKKMSAAVSEAALKSGWESTVSALGGHTGRSSAKGEASKDSFTVVVREDFDGGSIDLTVVYDGEGKVSGLWLKPVEEEAAAGESAAQTTDEYEEIATTVQADPDFPLDALLTLPSGTEKPPVVILVHGSGTSDKDENISGNKPFADIAHGLAAQGIATLRYDKRYFTNPEKAPALSDITLREEVLDDVAAAIELVKNDDRLDSDRIYVLGHSLGGMLTPAIASEHPELAGVISMAGSLRPLWEIMYDQNQEAIAAIDESALSDSDKALFASQKQQIEAGYETLCGDFSALSNDTPLMGIPAGYWKSLKEYCGMNFIDSVKMPMLILQGDADFQVYPDVDYPLWLKLLDGRDNVEFRLYEGLNHIMMPTQGKRDVSEYAVVGNVSWQFIDDICAFVNG